MLIDTSDYGVYVATRNDTDEVIYVGCSWKGMKRRLSLHINDLKDNRHRNQGLQRFWDSKGLTFTHVVKCLPIKSLVLAFEKAYGAQYDFKKLVNVNPLGLAAPDISGEKHHMYGKHHSKETRKKQSTIRKRKIALGEIVIWNKGKNHSEETIEKMKGENHHKYWLNKKKPDQSKRMKGENHPLAKLTEKRVRMIKVMFRSDIKTINQIAKLFNVCPETIRNIKKGKAWSDVKVRGWDY